MSPAHARSTFDVCLLLVHVGYDRIDSRVDDHSRYAGAEILPDEHGEPS